MLLKKIWDEDCKLCGINNWRDYRQVGSDWNLNFIVKDLHLVESRDTTLVDVHDNSILLYKHN